MTLLIFKNSAATFNRCLPDQGKYRHDVSVSEISSEEPATAVAKWRQAGEFFSGWLAGDEAQFNALVELMSVPMWHSARAYRIDEQAAEDAVQNAWLALWRNRDQIRDSIAVAGWLFTTVRREAGKLVKEQQKQSSLVDEELTELSPDIAITVAQLHDDENLWKAVSSLSERCNRLLRVLAFADRPNYQELSLELGMPIGSIGPTRVRCLQQLRKLIGELA